MIAALPDTHFQYSKFKDHFSLAQQERFSNFDIWTLTHPGDQRKRPLDLFLFTPCSCLGLYHLLPRATMRLFHPCPRFSLSLASTGLSNLNLARTPIPLSYWFLVSGSSCYLDNDLKPPGCTRVQRSLSIQLSLIFLVFFLFFLFFFM